MKYTDLVLNYKENYKTIGDLVSSTDEIFSAKYFPGGKPNKKFKPPFVSGEIYSFSYLTDTKISKSRDFINRNPIIIFIDSYKNDKYGEIVKGVDLLTIPPDIRIDIMSPLYDRFSREIESNEESYETGRIKIPLPLNSPNMESLWVNTGYKSSVFGFKLNYMRNISVLDLEDWYKIPYLKKNMIEGLDIQGIYNKYRSKLI